MVNVFLFPYLSLEIFLIWNSIALIFIGILLMTVRIRKLKSSKVSKAS